MPIADALENRTIEGFQIREYDFCSITISGGYSITTQSLLRYIGHDGAFFVSLDHNHQFGLPAPFDAEKAIREKIENKVIRQVRIDPHTGDLTLSLDDGKIEIICTSGGYEAYQLYGPNNLIVIGRGGCSELTC